MKALELKLNIRRRKVMGIKRIRRPRPCNKRLFFFSWLCAQGISNEKLLLRVDKALTATIQLQRRKRINVFNPAWTSSALALARRGLSSMMKEKTVIT